MIRVIGFENMEFKFLIFFRLLWQSIWHEAEIIC